MSHKGERVVDMAEVREERSPHARGTAQCLDCKHQWEAVAPLGTYWLQCPGCGLIRGKYLYTFDFVDQLHWVCACGNDLFYMLNDACYCPNCGTAQKGF